MPVLTINRGLVTSPNELAKPDGAAEILDNCVIDFDNIVQSRRGFAWFGNKTPDDTIINQLLTYKGRILRHYSNKLSYDSTGNGNFLDFDGNYSELVNRLRIKYFELNSNLYFTTNEGIKKISATSADDFTTSANYITNAGGVKAISFEAETSFSASGFLPAQSKVAYKILWARKDANGNVIRGVPTSRYVVTNTSQNIDRGESFKITVTTAGAGIHKEFNAIRDLSEGTQLSFIGTDVDVTANTITLTTGGTDHNYQTNDLIKLSAGAFTLPTGLSAGNYYVIRVDTNKIKLKTTIEGSEVDITATGTGGIVEKTIVGKTITSPSHGFVNNTKVRVFGNLPDELDSLNTYYIVNATTDTFQLSTTSGGIAIFLTKKDSDIGVYSGISSSDFFTFDTPTGKFACWFNISGEDIPPTSSLLVGRTLKEIEIYKINIKNKENYAAKIAETLFTITDIEVTISTDNVTVLNRDGGDVLDASSAGVDSLFLTVSEIINGQVTSGTPANVSMKINVPSEIVTSNDKLYFFEIYRTAVVTASVGAGLDVIDPGDEMQKIYEAPVEVDSITGLINSEILHLDDVAESFRQSGAFLYVNPVSGEGILQANEAPPAAHDVAVFKGSAFYANTRERHKLQFSMLDVSQFPKTLSYSIDSDNSVLSQGRISIINHELSNGNPIIFSGSTPIGLTAGVVYYVVEAVYEENEYGTLAGTTIKVSATLGGPSILISPRPFSSCTLTTQPFKLFVGNYNSLSEYTFSGRTQRLSINPQDTKNTVGGSYFDINSARNKVKYRFWMDKGSISYNITQTNINASTGTEFITITGHKFANNDKVTVSGTSLPGGLLAREYFVINRTDNTFQLSLTLSGSAINLNTNSGSATITHTSVAPESDSRILARVPLLSYTDSFVGSADAVLEVISNIPDFEMYEGLIWSFIIACTDNGEVDAPVQSTPGTGWTISVAQTGIGENASTNEVLLSGLASQALSIEDSARSLEKIINKDSNSKVSAFYLSGADDLPGQLLLEARSLTDTSFYLGFSNETVTEVFNPAIPVAKTVTNVSSSSVITTSINHGFSPNQVVYTYIKPTSVPVILSGTKTIATTPANNTLTISGFTNSTSYSSFDKALIFEATVVSDNAVNPNRLYFSKINQPEAVPLVNYVDIGPKDKAIQRILALRDSLIVLKEDGVYVVSGSAAPNFSVRLSDSSAITYAPDTATNLNNLIYVLTSQGVVTVSETGVGVISRNIENKIQEITNAKFDYKLMSWGMASESDRCYLLWLPERVNDVFATQAFRYNTFTRTWTRWTKPANCGVVNPTDDKIYLGDASEGPYVLKERKNFERQDYADREIVRGIGTNAINGTTYTISSVFDLAPGDSLVQKQYLDINKFNRTLRKLDRDNLLSSDYYSQLKADIGDNMADKLLLLASKLLADGITVPTPTNSNNVDALRSDFNAIINVLNLTSTSTIFKDYKLANEELFYETLVIDVDPRTNSIEVNKPNNFIQGDVSFFKGIKCIVQYAPQHFGKPESTKQVPDGTFIFDQNNFWGGVVAYASDRSYDFIPISFSGRGPGYWNGFNWAEVTFGGEGNEVPVRTLIPREKARCRYLHVQFTHINAREEWKLIGVSLEPREVSSRGYR